MRVQDFFQRVECEASVQLMRLKNAKLAAPPLRLPGDSII